MDLKESVSTQVTFMGKTPGGCKLVLHNLLDNGRDVLQFMRLFTEADVENFYDKYAGEINKLYIEDGEPPKDLTIQETVKLAVEKTLMLIEDEIKNVSRSH